MALPEGRGGAVISLPSSTRGGLTNWGAKRRLMARRSRFRSRLPTALPHWARERRVSPAEARTPRALPSAALSAPLRAPPVKRRETLTPETMREIEQAVALILGLG
jgi:hypothetical protein